MLYGVSLKEFILINVIIFNVFIVMYLIDVILKLIYLYNEKGF